MSLVSTASRFVRFLVDIELPARDIRREQEDIRAQGSMVAGRGETQSMVSFGVFGFLTEMTGLIGALAALIGAVIALLTYLDKRKKRTDAVNQVITTAPKTLKQVEQETGLGDSAVTTAVSRLVDKGLVERTEGGYRRKDTADGTRSLWGLLIQRGLPEKAKVKVARHKDSRCDLDWLEREGWMNVYQSYQDQRIFECDYVVSFIGVEGTRARFHGVFKVVLPATLATEHPMPADYPYPHLVRPGDIHYQLEPVPGFDDLKGIVIEWGSGTRTWHQWLKADSDKLVIAGMPGTKNEDRGSPLSLECVGTQAGSAGVEKPRDYGAAVVALLQALKNLRPGQEAYDNIVIHRDEVLARYGRIFSLTHVARLTKEEFTSFLYIENNRHWDHLYRKGLGAAEDMESVRQSLTVLLDERRPIRERYPEALGMVTGMGKALATAILTVAYPDKYGVWNNTSEEALRNVGLWATLGLAGDEGERYEKINGLLRRLTIDLKTDFWTLDALWWHLLAET